MTKKMTLDYLGVPLTKRNNEFNVTELYKAYKELLGLNWDRYGLSSKEFREILTTFFMLAAEQAIRTGNGVELIGTLGTLFVVKKRMFTWIDGKLVKPDNPTPFQTERYIFDVYRNKRLNKPEKVDIYYLLIENSKLIKYKNKLIEENIHYIQNYCKHETY